MWHSTCLWFPVHSVPEYPHFFLSIFIFSGHISKILILSSLFAHGGHRQHVHPSISPYASRAVRTCRSTGPSQCLLSLLECIDKISKRKNTLPSMKWGLKVSLKYLTPSSALRDSRLRSPLRISASPTGLFLQCWSTFSWFKHCKI